MDEQTRTRTGSPDPPERLLRKFSAYTALDSDAEAAVRSLPIGVRDVEPLDYVVREGDPSIQCCFLVTGFAIRHKVTSGGARQILSIHVPGDILDLAGLFLDISDHNVQMLSRGRIACLPHPLLERLTRDYPDLARAMWIDALIEGSIFREWILNVGRRDAHARIAHLLCEFAIRYETAGVPEDSGEDVQLPMTQEQIADAVGLTPVHVNRMLKLLDDQGLISRSRGKIRIENWHGLVDAADFTQGYLHTLQRLRQGLGGRSA